MCNVEYPMWSGYLSVHTEMSTEALFADPAAFDEALAALRHDGEVPNRNSWLLIGHVEGNPQCVDIVAVDNCPEASIEGNIITYL